MQIPHTDSDDYADLMDFIASSGRVANTPAVLQMAPELGALMWSARAAAMTQSIAALARAARIDAR